MKQWVVVALVVASIGPVSAVGGVGQAGSPFAEAGLDQSVEQGTTVVLDGTGSRDPDGRLVEYEWRIETPAGSTIRPRGRSKPRTTFVASDVGRYVVTLTVTDDTGATSSDSLYVDVDRTRSTTVTPPQPAPPTDSPPSPPSTPVPTTSPSSAPTDRSPTVRGPRLVTGERPLSGEYSVAVTDSVERIVWTVDGEDGPSGPTVSRNWSPGDHTLAARVIYVDGTTETATFADGSTRVVADPKPRLSLSNVDTQKRLAGAATATDGYGNLVSVDVTVEGLGAKRVDSDDGSRSEVEFDWADVELGREYELVATAVDERGQEVVVNRTLRPVGPPETISAEFVNGPVDSYHPRIDAERYTAHHVLKIDLNGHTSDEIDIRVEAEEPSVVRRVATRKISIVDGIAVVHTYWAGDSPSPNTPYRVKHTWNLVGVENSRTSAGGVSQFVVTPSKPEIRIEMRNDGTRPVGGSGRSAREPVDLREPVIIDASESFDPDGTTLTYIWKNGAEATEPDNAIGRLSGWESGKLVLEDDSGARAYQNWSAQETLVPSIASIDVLGDGPFSPDERVRVRVRTQVVQFRRDTADLDIGAELRGARGEVVEWNELYTDSINHENDFAYNGTIELPASALAKNGPEARLVLYNTERPSYARQSTTLPTVELIDGQRTGRGELTVTDLRYVIRKQTVETTTATSRAEMQQLVDVGYEVDATVAETVGYRIEERVQTQEEIIDTDSRAFGSSYNRRLFLKTHPDWVADGVRTDRYRVPTTHTTWKRSAGSGFTGETRRVLVDHAEYSVEREYEYTTTETRTREMTSYQCPLPGRCYEVTYERTVYRDVTHTYWAHSKQLSHHSATGDVRRTLVDPAEYATEYRHQYTTWRTETDREYVASHTTVVQPAKYTWREVDTVTNERVAWRQVSGRPDYRIGERLTDRSWTMVRRGTEEVVRPAYTSEDVVVETRATVSGDVIRYRTAESGLETAKVVREFTRQFTTRGVVSKAEIKERVRESGGVQ